MAETQLVPVLVLMVSVEEQLGIDGEQQAALSLHRHQVSQQLLRLGYA
jgi:hypothetical protein